MNKQFVQTVMVLRCSLHLSHEILEGSIRLHDLYMYKIEHIPL